MFFHYIDIIPFVLATMVILLGSSKLSAKRPITMVVIFTTGIYMVAQSHGSLAGCLVILGGVTLATIYGSYLTL